MRKFFFTLKVVLVMALAALNLAAQKRDEPAPPSTISGEVVKIDATAGILTLETALSPTLGVAQSDKRIQFKVTKKTEFTSGEEMKLADVPVGAAVTIFYTGKEPNCVASSIEIHWVRQPPAPRSVDSLLLPGEEPIDGRFLAWMDNSVRWELPAAESPNSFRRPPQGVVRFASRGNHPTPEARWTVRLTTGDVLTADSLTLDAKRFTLTNPTLGKLEFRRDQVGSIHRGVPRSGFAGRQWLADWDRLSYPAEGKEATAAAYRDILLPDRVAVELSLSMAPQTGPSGVYLRIFTEPKNPHSFNGSENGYYISLNRQYVSVGSQNVGGSTVKMEGSGPAVKICVCFDRRTGEAQIIVDGTVKQRAKLGSLPASATRGISIRSDELPDFIVVKPWEENPSEVRESTQLANGDLINGTLESITPEAAVFMVAQLGRLNVPVERLANITLAAPALDEAHLKEGATAVGLSGGGNLTGTLSEFTATHLSFDCAWGSQLMIPREDLRWIRWGVEKPFSLKTRAPSYSTLKPGTLELVQGQRLRGSLISIRDGIVMWQHPAAEEPLALRLDQAALAILAPAVRREDSERAFLSLKNGDRLHGKFLELGPEFVRFQPAGLGTFDFPRTTAASLRPGAIPTGVLDTGESANWKVNAELIADKSANARFKRPPGTMTWKGTLPERLALQFEWMQDEKRPASLSVLAYGQNDPTVKAIKAPTLQTQPGLVNGCILFSRCWFFPPTGMGKDLMKLMQKEPNEILAHYGLDGTPRPPRPPQAVVYTWLIDRPKKEMCLLADGELILKGTSPNAFPAGDLIEFQRHDPSSQVRNIVLSEWRATPQTLTNSAPPGTDSVWLHDMTRLNGRLTQSSTEKLHLAHDGRETDLALGRVARIVFQTPPVETSAPAKGLVRVSLPNGDQITLSAIQCDTNGLSGTAAVIGAVTISSNLVTRLDFKPPNPKPAQPPPGSRRRN